jgi:hypothetical protein
MPASAYNKSVVKAVIVLRFLEKNGRSSAAEVARATGLTRTTARRILDAFVEAELARVFLGDGNPDQRQNRGYYEINRGSGHDKI